MRTPPCTKATALPSSRRSRAGERVTPAQDLPDDEVRSRLAAAQVVVLGCGGLGSNVAVMLVRASVRTADPRGLRRSLRGQPQSSALLRATHRQAQDRGARRGARRIGPKLDLRLHTETHHGREPLALVEGADVIVEAVDTAETKALITNVCTAIYPTPPS